MAKLIINNEAKRAQLLPKFMDTFQSILEDAYMKDCMLGKIQIFRM